MHDPNTVAVILKISFHAHGTRRYWNKWSLCTLWDFFWFRYCPATMNYPSAQEHELNSDLVMQTSCDNPYWSASPKRNALAVVEEYFGSAHRPGLRRYMASWVLCLTCLKIISSLMAEHDAWSFIRHELLFSNRCSTLCGTSRWNIAFRSQKKQPSSYFRVALHCFICWSISAQRRYSNDQVILWILHRITSGCGAAFVMTRHNQWPSIDKKIDYCWKPGARLICDWVCALSNTFENFWDVICRRSSYGHDIQTSHYRRVFSFIPEYTWSESVRRKAIPSWNVAS